MENIVIAGSGPAGLTAALYAARAQLQPLVFEGYMPGGQLTVSHAVENFPCLSDPITGLEMMQRLRKQAVRFGVRFRSAPVEKAENLNGLFKIVSEDNEIETRTLIIATGAEARRLPIPTEPRFYGKGVSGCATCDGTFFREKKVLVIGGGNTAIQDALFLAQLAGKVTLVHRRRHMKAEAVEVEKIKRNPKIEWMVPWTVEEILGESTVTGAVLKHSDTGEKQTVPCDGIFVAIGHDPKTGIFKDIVETDENGYIQIKTGSTRTYTPGVFACGDVCDPVYKQAVVAAGQGCMAALDAQKYLEKWRQYVGH